MEDSQPGWSWFARIGIVNVEGLTCPVPVCSVCERLIDGGSGLAWWPDGKNPEVTFLHQGECSLRFQRVNGSRNTRMLRDLLKQILANHADNYVRGATLEIIAPTQSSPAESSPAAHLDG